MSSGRHLNLHRLRFVCVQKLRMYHTHPVGGVGGGAAVVVDGGDGLVVGGGRGGRGGSRRAGRGVDGQPRVGVPPVVGEVHVRLRGKEEGEYSERKSLMVNFGAKLCVLQDGKLN